MDSDVLAHVGVGHERSTPGSGRYRWGSGEQPFQRGGDFLSACEAFRKAGMSEVEMAQALGMTTTEFRARRSAARANQRSSEIAAIRQMHERGMSERAIAAELGISQSTVRNRLKVDEDRRKTQIDDAERLLKDQLEKGGYIEVGLGVEQALGCSSAQLKTALYRLQDEGYEVHEIYIPQPGDPKRSTTLKVLCPAETTKKEVLENVGDIRSPGVLVDDLGNAVSGPRRPVSISSKRVDIRWDEDGGSQMDGVIELRRGVADLDLNGKQYAQVRILVDGTHYIKGMAIYADDLPAGTDIRVNSNKSKEGRTTLDALKKTSGDPDNPFSANIKAQRMYKDKDGKEHQSALNIMREEGDWDTWSRSLSAQMLSKQRPAIAAEQLKKRRDKFQAEFDEIMAMNNPVVRKRRLMELAEKCDSDAVDLKAAALPRQSNQVILPCTKLKANEIYAPNYRNGEKVVLIRHPHAGTFEIPELTVNNRNAAARKLLGKNLKDAVGIHPSVAEKLSGADFDGDTVVVIPNNDGRIKHSPSLSGLKGFDPKKSYPGTPTSKRMTKKTTQLEMGKISNLITDMTVHGASPNELARAVRHSMVVIDACKHELDYKQSEKDNDIAGLRKKYQPTGGSSTLISRSKSPVYVPKTKARAYRDGGPIDPKTGREMRVRLPDITKADGTKVTRKVESTKMRETRDARSLMSSKGSAIETVYANHANSLKAMANTARKAAISQPRQTYSPTQAKQYAHEVSSLRSKLKTAQANKPRERQAQVVTNQKLKQYKADHPEASPDELKKYGTKTLARARAATGASRTPVSFTTKEWEAINKGAVTQNMLESLLDASTTEEIVKVASPRRKHELTGTTKSRASTMASKGYTIAEIASALGVTEQAVRNSI